MLHKLNHKSEDGRTLLGKQGHTHFQQTPAKVRASALVGADYYRRRAAALLEQAKEMEALAAEATTFVSREDLLEDTRMEILARLQWAASLWGKKHSRGDLWPEHRQGEHALVVKKIQGCQDLDRLVRWSMLCEEMPEDWVDRLSIDVLSGDPLPSGAAQ